MYEKIIKQHSRSLNFRFFFFLPMAEIGNIFSATCTTWPLHYQCLSATQFYPLSKTIWVQLSKIRATFFYLHTVLWCICSCDTTLCSFCVMAVKNYLSLGFLCVCYIVIAFSPNQHNIDIEKSQPKIAWCLFVYVDTTPLCSCLPKSSSLSRQRQFSLHYAVKSWTG